MKSHRPNKNACFGSLVLTLLTAASTAQTTAFPGVTALTQSSLPLNVTLTVVSSGIVSAPLALTQGLTNADFTIVSGGSCAAATAYTSGQQCTVNVVFQPKFPGLRRGAVVMQASTGAAMATAFLTGIATGSLPVLAPGRIDTVAGDIDWIFHGDGGPATQSPIFLPTGVTTDAAGDIFLSDSQNNRIRRVDAVTGLISTIAGTGTPGYQGNGVLATQTMVSTPNGITLDGAGNVYIADTGNHIIRRIDVFTGTITTVAGTPMAEGYSGDGGAPTHARLSFPQSIIFDSAGDLLIADTGNNVVRQIDADTGLIRTVAGIGTAGFSGDGQMATSAQLSSPWNIAVALDGSIYIADLGNNRIRRIDPSGNISTIAGTGPRAFSGDGADASQAALSEPAALVFDPAGNLYIADSGNNRVREIAASTNIISTLSGTGSEQFEGDAGPANLASLYGPNALFFDSSGNLFVADMFHNRIRRISASATALLYDTIKVGKLSPPQPVSLANDGNADLHLTAPLFVNAAEDPATTTCTTAADIPSAGTCVVGAVFAPTVTGNPVAGSITVQSDSPLTAPVIDLSGEVLSIAPTSISLASSANPSLVGAAVTFTASVANGDPPLTGTIVFLDGTTQLCSVAIANASATCTPGALALGSHNITAAYSGDNNNAASTSSVLVQVVKQAPALTLTASPNPIVVSASVTMSLAATAPAGTPTGAVTFYDGSTALGSATLSASGIAGYSTTALTPGTHSLSVHYPGDASNMPAQSNIVSEVVQQATTTTTLFSSSATATAGTPVAFTAVVFSANGPTPTGTVAFKSGTTTLGTAPLGADGNAVLSLSTLTPGTYTVVAVYSGDTDDETSTSAPLVETIQQIATTITLTSDINPIAAGATLHLSSIVGGATAAGGTLTGKVRFHEGSTTYGSATLDASGNASLSLNTLSAGSHNLVATFVGDTDYATSTSAILVEVVDSTSSTTVLTSPAATTLAGEPATFTATVSSSTSTPTGNVIFSDGSTNIGQAQLNAQGVATFVTSTLNVGVHTLTAAYGGDGSYNASTSSALQHTVILATTALTLAAPSGTIEAGKAFSLTATLTSNGIAPTGALTLRDSGVTIATQTVAAAGTFTFPNVTLSVGTHSLTAVYAGDANNASATSALVSVIVVLAPTTTSVATSSTPASLGQTVTFTASISTDSPNPTGSISFKDGTTVIGTSTVAANGTATLTSTTLAFGSHTITAIYSGDANHATSTSASLVQQIVYLASATITSSANPSNAGANLTFTAHIGGTTSTVPTGTVVFKDGTTTLGTSTLDANGNATIQTAALAVGSHPISANYGGDANYSTASANLVQTVQSATTQIVLSASSNPETYATPLTLTAVVTGNGGTATGTVTFADGATSIGSAQLNANGIAMLTNSSLSPGTHSIVANYAGNSSTGASSSTPLTLSVKQSTGITLASNADPTTTLSAFTLTATVINSSIGVATGSIVFTDASTQLGIAQLNASGIATLPISSMSAGSHSLQASYAGDTTDFASASPTLGEVIQLRPTSVTLTGTSNDPANAQQVTLIAVVRWNGPGAPSGIVAFTTGSSTIGSSPVDSTGVATLTITLSSTSESIVATYSGDQTYATSASPITSITEGTPTQLTLQLDPPSVTFASKQHTTVDLTMTSLNSFTDTMQFGCLGLPYAATCTFSKTQAVLAANATSTVQLTIDTGDPLGAGATAFHRSPSASSVLLCLLPCLLGIGLGARRRRFKPATLFLVLFAAAMTLTAAGCSALQINGTPPGTYTFKVTAAGVNTGTTSSQTMTLTVTQ